MANTLIQNCQRGLVFLVFLEILFISIMITIKLIKRLIDPLDSSSVSDSKYKEGDKDKKDKPSMDADAAKAETSLYAFDHKAIRTEPPKEEDTTIEKLIKRTYEIYMLYLPICMVYPLNLVTGTSKAFSIVNFFMISACIIFFNVAKLHRQCIEHKVIRLILYNMYLLLCFFMLLNVWTTTPVLQPYSITA